MRSIVGLLAVSFLLVADVTAEDWPNWRGPSRDGRSSDAGVPTQWSASEGIAWKLEMPTWSGSTPIVWGDYVFVSTADGGKRVERRGRGRAPVVEPESETLSLWCIDRGTGEVLWKRGLGGGNKQLHKQNMSSPSPVTDGKHVWALTGAGVLKGFDFAGTELWSRDIQADYGTFGLNWGYASSPGHSGRSLSRRGLWILPEAWKTLAGIQRQLAFPRRRFPHLLGRRYAPTTGSTGPPSVSLRTKWVYDLGGPHRQGGRKLN